MAIPTDGENVGKWKSHTLLFGILKKQVGSLL